MMSPLVSAFASFPSVHFKHAGRRATLTMQDETTLEARVRAHDESALVAYIEVVRPRLMAVIEKKMSAALRGKVEAEDILQELSIDCVRALPQIHFDEREVFPWLCKVAERRIIDAQRRFFAVQKRAANREIGLHGAADDDGAGGLINLLVASMTSPSAAFSRDRKEFQLAAAIDSLAEENRLALRMRYVENKPTREIAAELGKSDGAVRVMLTRSLKKLQKILGPDAAPR
jgi:RNA polymerase sigma-70 factor (ECF subfamily)